MSHRRTARSAVSMATFLAPAVVAAGALIRLRRSYEAERRLRVELEHMSRATAAVAEAVADVSAADVSAVLTMIALQAQSLTRAEYVALGICGGEPDQPFHPWVFEGMTDDVARAIGRHPRPVGTLGRVARDGRVVRSADVRGHPDFAGLPPGHPEMASFLGVPVHYRGKPVGNLYLANRPGGAEFSDSDEHVVRMLAARVGAAIETATHYAGATREHAWLQSVVDQMPDAVVVYDERGRVHAANQASVPLSCADADRRDPFGNCVMLDLRELDGSALAAGRWPTVRVLRGREGIVREEMLARLSTGKLCPVAVSAAPVLSAGGEITGAMLIVQDVSAHKELERLREQWDALVAHDLRQPVQAICIAAETLRRRGGELPERDAGALDRIVSTSKRLDRMINDLLDASRIESNQLTIERQTVALGTLVESVVAAFASCLSGHAVRVNVAPELLVSFDPDRMHQVLGNLLSNASKYASPDSEIRIDADARDGAVEVTVTNYGPGIAPDQARLLFSRFLRLGARRAGWASGAPPGIGLGLYIAKGLVEAHGGRIWVESTPGDATRFHFTVPTAS